MKEKTVFGDYYDYLESKITFYRGKLPDYVYHVPSLFRALTGVLERLVQKLGVSFVSPFRERDEDPLEDFLPYVLEETARELTTKTVEILSSTGLRQ